MTDEFDPDDEIEIEPRPTVEVGQRLIALGAVCRRVGLETGQIELTDDDEETARFDLIAWLTEEGLDGALSIDERAFLRTPLGQVEPDPLSRQSWAGEAVVALAWAVGLLEAMPTYDRATDPGPVLRDLPLPWDSTQPFLGELALRELEALAFERERAELWDWRAGLDSLGAPASGGDEAQLRRIVGEVAAEAAEAGLLPTVVAGDFPVDGVAFAGLTAERREEIEAVAAQRRGALDWLLQVDGA